MEVEGEVVTMKPMTMMGGSDDDYDGGTTTCRCLNESDGSGIAFFSWYLADLEPAFRSFHSTLCT